jgi:hypothetical protein
MTFLRAGVRIPVELPALISWKNRAGKPMRAVGKTAMMSGNGLFVAVHVRLPHETPVIITVNLPLELTKVPLQLLCQGRVVRQEKSGAISGIGATIDEYHFRPAERPV